MTICQQKAGLYQRQSHGKNFDIEPYISRLTKRKLRTGRVVTGGIVTIKDSNWLMSFATHRQPHFKEQGDQQTVTWVYGLLSNTPGNYIKTD